MKTSFYILSKVSIAMAVVLSFICSFTTIGRAAYPTKSIDLVVPFTPGGGTDLVARVLAEALTKKWQKSVNVINKPGGSCVIGTNFVMRSDPDGYTILLDGGASSSVHVVFPNLPYNVESRTFIAGNSLMPGVFVVPANSPIRNLSDVVREAKKDLANFTWTSLGGMTQTDMSMRLFFDAAGIDVSKTKAIMYSGGGTALNALAGGHVKFGASGGGSVVPLLSSGLIRIISVNTPMRARAWPDIPTTAEQNFPTVNNVSWFGFSGPPGLPEEVISVWNQKTKEILADPEVVTKLEKVASSYPMYLNSSEFKNFVLNECEMVKRLLGGK